MRQININNELLLKFVNNVFLIVLPITLLLMGFINKIFIIIYIIYLIILLIKKKKELIYAILIISILISINYFINNKIYDVNRYKNEEISIEGVIIDKYQYDESYYRYTLNVKTKDYLLKKKIYVYANINYDIDDVIEVNGIIREIDGERIPNSFNYESYLNRQKIYMVINANNIIYKETKLTFNRIKKIVNNYFDKHFSGNTLITLKGLVLGDTSGFSEETNESLKQNGILHLFAVSGLHISLFIALLSFALKLLRIKDNIIERIIIIFLIMYMIITSFSISIVRAGLMYIFGLINKHYFKKLFSSSDVISTLFILILLINPYYAYNTGFILSFMVSFVIVLLSPLVKNESNSYQIFIISLISNLVTLPIIININYEYNILTPLLNVLYINLVSSFILPFGFIVLVLPILSLAYDFIINSFLKLISFTSNINLVIHLPYFNSIALLIYYSLILLIILFINNKRKKNICYITLFMFLIISSFFGYIKINPEINFLYLNDGDSTVIRYLNQVIVVDTGDGYNDEVLNYLKSIGVRKIDYLIITHCHDDHYGGSNKIIDEIDVKKVITSIYYNYNYDNQIKVNYRDNIKLKGMELYFLSPINKSNNENDNSLVFLLTIKNKRILFTADATIQVEEDIINELKRIDINSIDIIKVAHHGSNSSTGNELLSYLKIDYAVIMAGKMRKLTHPSSETIERLNNYNIIYYNTVNDYSITLKIKNNGIYFNTLNSLKYLSFNV